jgi:pyruvate/2-oxoglutarate dehydrogenase complex dihydrolipoamide dehydrogenase (E3) component
VPGIIRASSDGCRSVSSNISFARTGCPHSDRPISWVRCKVTLGDETGMLKLFFDRNTRKLLGVHAVGQRATEIIHIGRPVFAYGDSIHRFRKTVFN